MACRKTAQHEADHREAHERSRFTGVPFVIAGQPTTAADPGQRSFNDPSLREHDEAVAVTAAHDLERPRAGSCYDGLHLAALIARIRDDPLQKGEAPSRLSQQRLGPIPILHACGMHSDGQEQAERVGQDVALAAGDLLARIIPGRVERSPLSGLP